MANGPKKSRKKYRLLGPNGVKFNSYFPGKFGGYRPTKVYGRLDCPSALRWLEKGHYAKQRVFFLTEEDAIAAGYHPCGVCMRKSK
jgi:hypothetical protein